MKKGERNILIGSRFKEIREQAELSQQRFGDLFGVTRFTVCRWEAGEVSNVKREIILTISDKFNINPAWILGFDVPKRKRTQKEDELETKISEKLVWLDEGQLTKLLKFMEEFL